MRYFLYVNAYYLMLLLESIVNHRYPLEKISSLNDNIQESGQAMHVCTYQPQGCTLVSSYKPMRSLTV